MQQRYFDGRTGQEIQPPSNRPNEKGMLDQLMDKLKGLVGEATSPIVPNQRRDQVERQEQGAESPDAPQPTPTKGPDKTPVRPTPKPKKAFDGWVDAGYGTDPTSALNANGQQWQGSGPPIQPPQVDPAPKDPTPVMPGISSAPPQGQKPSNPLPAPGTNPQQGVPPVQVPPPPGPAPMPPIPQPPQPTPQAPPQGAPPFRPTSKKPKATKKHDGECPGPDYAGTAPGAYDGFKQAQGQIAAKEGVPMKNAGAILASASRKASPAAKAKNPNLKKVK